MQIKKTNGMFEALVSIGKTAEAQMKEATNKEEKAFLFGHLNLAVALSTALLREENGVVACHINLDYEDATKQYEEAVEFAKRKECKQISMEEMFPELFKLIKSVVNETQEESKNSKKTKKSKKE